MHCVTNEVSTNKTIEHRHVSTVNTIGCSKYLYDYNTVCMPVPMAVRSKT